MTSRNPVTGLSRRTFLIGGAAGAAAPLLLHSALGSAAAGALPRAFGFPAADTTARVVRPMMFPVVGTVTWSDTYGACRDGCTRRHEGQDLLGKKLQKLVACVDGKVVALRHESGGNSLYLEDADGWYYAYLHINNDTPGTDDGANPIAWAFAPGLAEGDTVTKGQHVAYLGDSGNAEGGAAHCHFEVRRPTSQGVWHSQAVNPKPSLDAATPAVDPGTTTFAGPTAATGAYVPWATATALITQQYLDFLGHAPSDGSLALYKTVLETKQHTPAWVVQVLLDSDENQDSAGAVARLYRAYFGRDADFSGFDYWLKRIRAKTSTPASVSESFATSSEFVRTYGSLSDDAFVSTVYRNVLGRDADAAGKAFWVDQLKRKLISRGRLMLRFSESAENKAALATRIRVVLMYAQMLKRIPAPVLVDTRVKQIDGGATTTQKLLDQIRLGTDYGKRFA